jgi:exonuclease SbcC
MIPLKLQLKNFLSYGADIQTIDFSAYPLICLSGKNGHGKSAMLDAITWALWGQARKISGSSKPDQGLLRLGQTHMMVILDFEFNSTVYRVKREFALTYGKPLAGLDFGVVNEDDAFVPLTDKTISLTQDVIEKTLNLSYESFSNSAFLRQGQSNEFSKKSPKERKDILATILGLNQYENVKKLALEKIRQLQVDKTTRMALQEKLELELQKTGALNEQILHVANTLATVAQEEKNIAQRSADFIVQQQILRDDQQKHAMLTFQYNQLHTQHQELELSLKNTLLEWRSIHTKQLRAQDTQKLQNEKVQLVSKITEHQNTLQKGLELKEQYLKAKEQLQSLALTLQAHHTTLINEKKLLIDRVKNELQTTNTGLQTNTKEAGAIEAEKKTIALEQARITTELKSQQKIVDAHTKLVAHFERRKEHYQIYLEQGRQLTAELESLEQKKQLAHDDEDPSCPLCEQNLSAARKRFLKTKFIDQEKSMRHKLTRITKIVKELKQILIDQHKDLESSKSILEKFKIIAMQFEEHEKNVHKLQSKHAEITTLITQLTKHKEDLEKKHSSEQQELNTLVAQEASALTTNAEYVGILAALEQLQQAMKALSYNGAAHKQATESLAHIERRLAEQSELISQMGAQDQRKKTINELCASIKQIKLSKASLLAQQEVYKTLSERLEQIKTQELQLKEAIALGANTKEKLLQEKVRLETQQATLAQYDKEHKELQATVLTLNDAIFDYQAIASATGKDGIQALLIEDTIPEIEQEANNLLSRLTNNQSQVFFESLRDLKKGGTKETLDIKISDASGIRPYEMFSGGEAFRIDFALRIAISKLLARRAGTSLQTLIIDEGFGSQDEEGLGLIMDALYKIQDDFSKIIIVSHLPSMKDQFPVHFVIEKGPQGSSVSVIEQG